MTFYVNQKARLQHLMMSGGERQEDIVPQTLEDWNMAAIDGQEVNSWPSLPLRVQLPLQPIGTSLPDTASPRTAHVMTGDRYDGYSEQYL